MQEVNFEDVFAKFKPEAAVFVVSINHQGRPNGMICGWQMKCSAKPPLFAVALSKRGYTHKLIEDSQEFVVAVPNKELEEQLKYFGSCHGDQVDKFKESGIETIPAKKIKSPLLKKATINMECKLFKEIDAGDHFIFIGEIVAAYLNPEKKILFNIKKVGQERVFAEF